MTLFTLKHCHASTLSQARDNNRVNPSGVNNTFLELAQGFQTSVHTYNSPITGEYITKLGKKYKRMCIHIYIRGSSAYKYTTQRIHSIQKKVYLYNMSERKNTHQASKKIQQLPSTRGIGNTHYST